MKDLSHLGQFEDRFKESGSIFLVSPGSVL